MEQPVKILLSSDALERVLYSLRLNRLLKDKVIDILVEPGKLIIGGASLDVENKGEGSLQITAERLVYLRDILHRLQDCPILLIIRGDSLFLSEIYI